MPSLFKNFRKRSADTLQAAVLDTSVVLQGKEFGPGDYMLLVDGEIEGAKKEEFEALYEPMRVYKPGKKPGRKKAEATETGAEATNVEAEAPVEAAA